MTEPTTDVRRPPGPAPLGATANITTFGSLWWLGIVWVLTLVAFGVILLITSLNDADIEDSLWQGVGAGWQRWVVLGAGWSMVPSFAPMLLTHGVTRRRLAQAAVIAGAVISVACAAVVVLGYGIEDVVFDRNGWDHVLDGGEEAGGIRFLLEASMEVAIVMAAYFVTGWLIGVAAYRHGKDSLVWFLVPCLAPAVLVELLIASRTGNFGFGFLHDALDSLGQPSASLGAPLAVAVVAASAAVASRSTRGVELKG